MMRTVAHLMPFVALAGGLLILLMPRLLNYVVAIYLILSARSGSTISTISSADCSHGQGDVCVRHRGDRRVDHPGR